VAPSRRVSKVHCAQRNTKATYRSDKRQRGPSLFESDRQKDRRRAHPRINTRSSLLMTEKAIDEPNQLIR
jgi:hypothetical protein